MAVKREKIHLETLNELLGAPDVVDGHTEIRIDQIRPFKDHPFKVLDNNDMNELVTSIKENGVIVPVMVRPDGSGYEMISGHRRMHAAKLAGLKTIPAIIKEMTDDEATIAMVDSNMQREQILPSERAFSLKMKMDALKRQGERNDLTSDHEGPRLAARDAGRTEGISATQVKRYIRLTELIPEMLELVDNKRLSITLGVEISYLGRKVQEWLLEYCRVNGMIRQSQIDALKETDTENMSQQQMILTLNGALPQKKEFGKLTLSRSKLDRFFPKSLTNSQREDIIMALLEEWKEKQNAEGDI